MGSVIGANSVVTRDTIPYGVYAGSPAKLIRRRFSDRICAALEASQWWDISRENLVRMPLGDVPALVELLALLAECRPPKVAFPETYLCIEAPPA